jgi:hypothetical protein
MAPTAHMAWLVCDIDFATPPQSPPIPTSIGDPQVLENYRASVYFASVVRITVLYLPTSVKLPTYGQGNVLDKLQSTKRRNLVPHHVPVQHQSDFEVADSQRCRAAWSQSRPRMGSNLPNSPDFALHVYLRQHLGRCAAGNTVFARQWAT